MSDEDLPERAEESRPAGPDQLYADAFLQGYAEGARSALREILTQASQGRTVGELRLLLQSRLAHLPEELEARRRRLLSAPRASPWPAARPAKGPPRPWGGAPAAPRLVAGSQILFREERPRRALEAIRDGAERFSAVVVVSENPTALDGVRIGQVEALRIGSSGGITLESLGGQLRSRMRQAGGALVYLDALETIALQDGAEPMLRFVTWLLGEARDTSSAVVASVHPRVLPPKDQSLLERAFLVVL